MGRLKSKRALITGGTSGIGLETARQFISEGARVAVTGTNPETLEAARRELGPSVPVIKAAAADVKGQKVVAETIREAFGSLDIVFINAGVACLDIQGKLLGRPVCDLLGGAVRDRVPFSAYLFFKFAAHIGEEPDEWGEVLTPDQMVGEARRMVDKYGFQSLKLKGGVLHPDLEIETMLKLREAFSDHPLRIDPNGGWTIDTAIYIARKLEGVLEYLEDPVIGMDQMAQVAAATSIPLATNMIVLEFDQIARAFRKNAVQIVLSDHHYWGGLRASTHLGKICETLGLGVSMHSNSHLGITLAAMTHVTAATPNLSYDCDTHFPWTDVDVTEGVPFVFERGSLEVPKNPGLGISLDRHKLSIFAGLYEQTAMKERDDTAYMKLFEPDYERRVPRW